MLRTRATGLAAGRYDVFVWFWSNPNEDWRIRAGLAPNELRTFRKQSSETAIAADATTPLVLTGSTVRLYKLYLGRVNVPPNGTLDVFGDRRAQLPIPHSRPSRSSSSEEAVGPQDPAT